MSGRRRLPRSAVLRGEAHPGSAGTGFQRAAEKILPAAAAALAEHAGSFRERKVPAPVTAETGAEVVLNWAFLVSPAALAEFRGRLARLNEGEAFPGLMLLPTGPWPPYSFVPDLSAGAPA